jgi:hypothetical protein
MVTNKVISKSLGAFAAAILVCFTSRTATAAPVPDLSGTWAREFVGLEQPASGPGPITNRSRLPTGQSSLALRVGDYTDPILKPEAAEVLRQRGEISLSGKAFPDPSNQCAPIPMPLILQIPGIQILQEPDQVTILYIQHHQVRRIRMNQSHPARMPPSWHGDSVGHYEGDTLVVDTVGVKGGPLSMVDLMGTPQSEAVHVVERYRLIGYEAAVEAAKRTEKEHIHIRNGIDGVLVDPDYKGKGLQLQFTVEDPNVFTAPWSAKVTFQRALNPFFEWICAENRAEYYSGRDTPVPTAENPDF